MMKRSSELAVIRGCTASVFLTYSVCTYSEQKPWHARFYWTFIAIFIQRRSFVSDHSSGSGRAVGPAYLCVGTMRSRLSSRQSGTTVTQTPLLRFVGDFSADNLSQGNQR